MSTTTHAQIDAMNVDQLKALLCDDWKLGKRAALRGTRKPDLVRQAHAYLGLADAKGEDEPFPPPGEPPAPPIDSDDAPAHGEATPDGGSDDYQPAPNEPGVELEVAAESVIPDHSAWQTIMDIAETVALANLAPKDLRGRGNIGNARLVLLAARDLGIPMTTAIQKLAPVNGRLVMSAELMAALIRRDGHLLSIPASDWSGCTVVGKRADTGEEMTVTFTLEDAEQAELIESARKDNGRPKARSQDNKPLPWELYSSDLCYARAMSRLARRLFPDCLGGISYTPEELGSTSEYDDAGSAFGSPPPAQPDATQSIEEQRAELGRRIADLPDGLQSVLRDEWKHRNLPPLKSAPVGVLRQIRRLVEDSEREAAPPPDDTPEDALGEDGQPIDEAEVVHDQPADTPTHPPCASCTLPIAPGLGDDGTGEMIEQPIEIAGSLYHAACAPF